MERIEDQKIYQDQFMQLVIGIQHSTWMMLGKVANPFTGKLEINLEGAKQSIDTLLMLQAKTKGNLSKQEDDLLTNAIQQLQLNYIEESKKPAESKESDKKEENNPVENEQKISSSKETSTSSKTENTDKKEKSESK